MMLPNRYQIALATLALAGVAGPAAAAEEGGNPMAFDLVPFVSALVVFGLALFVLSRTAWPKILSGLDEREKKIRSEIYAAELARKEAQEAQAAFTRELAAARAEAQKMIEQTRAEQARLAADLRVSAEAELGQMREQARAVIEAAKRAAIVEIHTHAANLATSIAGKILQREVNEGDQHRLVEESVQEFAREHANA